MGKGLGPVHNAGAGHQLARLVGGFHHHKAGRQIKALVHVQCADQLPGQQVTAGIARHHQRKQRLLAEALGAVQGRKPVDEGRQVGVERIVVVGADHHHRVRRAHGGVDLLHHQAAVKAAALLAVATVLGGCSGQPSDSEPTQTALAGEVETTAPTTTTTSTTSELLQLAGEIDISESDAVTSSDS